MCLAMPMRIVEKLPPHHARVEAGGVGYRVNLKLLPDVPVGAFVIVHAGYAIERLDEEEAARNIAIFEDLGRAFES